MKRHKTTKHDTIVQITLKPQEEEKNGNTEIS